MRPLEGKSVLVTRPKHQIGPMVAELQALGATVFQAPAIEVAPPADQAAFDESLRKIDTYDWVVFTSYNGVAAVLDRLNQLSVGQDALDFPSVAAIGPATAAEFERCIGRAPEVVPAEYVSEAIADAIGDVDGKRILLPRADIARRDLAVILREKGAIVDEVAAYRILPATGPVELPSTCPDFITLTSSAAARSTLDLLRQNGHEDWFRESRLVTIGPITSGTVKALGYEIAAEAAEYTVPGVIRAIVDATKKEAAHA